MSFEERSRVKTMLLMSEENSNQQKGITLVEYAVMLVLIAIVVLTAIPTLSIAVTNVFSSIDHKVTDWSAK